jgi:DNA-binding NarL/FixJ family response regulator
MISLVLTDVEMPEMDGYILTKKIKTDPRFAGVPVIMHSSLSGCPTSNSASRWVSMNTLPNSSRRSCPKRLPGAFSVTRQTTFPCRPEGLDRRSVE